VARPSPMVKKRAGAASALPTPRMTAGLLSASNAFSAASPPETETLQVGTVAPGTVRIGPDAPKPAGRGKSPAPMAPTEGRQGLPACKVGEWFGALQRENAVGEPTPHERGGTPYPLISGEQRPTLHSVLADGPMPSLPICGCTVFQRQ
jgi:hypothetical protein